MKRFSGDGAQVALKLLTSLQAARLSGDAFLIGFAEQELDSFDGDRAYKRARSVHAVPGPKRPPVISPSRERPTTRAGRAAVRSGASK